MRDQYYKTLFTQAVQDRQSASGTREKYQHVTDRPTPDALGDDEKAFIESRSSCYIATVSESGWPYIQHRGGPVEFMKVLGPKTLGFADYAGNKQFVSAGNLDTNDRVSLFFMDYARRARLKMLATAKVVAAADDPELRRQLHVEGGPEPERLVTLQVHSFDWNCPKYIERRFTETEMQSLLGPKLAEMTKHITMLEARLTAVDPTWKEQI